MCLYQWTSTINCASWPKGIQSCGQRIPTVKVSDAEKATKRSSEGACRQDWIGELTIKEQPDPNSFRRRDASMSILACSMYAKEVIFQLQECEESQNDCFFGGMQDRSIQSGAFGNGAFSIWFLAMVGPFRTAFDGWRAGHRTHIYYVRCRTS